ncbi:MAG TPA: flagellar basal body P-ring formation chaperone FlgA [Burkholderiaceae bacterium]|jgi:flagella basal body P-ring formation protein FlgA|nr:flagellar basal body P-ring formation chaperone FlgA [Burkholderiaceae bacterium]
MRRLSVVCLLLLTCGWPAAGARAQLAALSSLAAPAAAAAPSADPTEAAIRILVERELGTRNRLVIQVGQFDTRVQLAPCARAEPFVPPGVRLWGRTQVGIRCTAGASWAIRLPVNIQVFAQVAVANGPLTPGTPLSAADAHLEEFDLTRENAPLVTDTTTLNGKHLTRSVAAGQPLRVDALRTPPSINAGDPVQIIVTGQGFTLASEGVALSSGSEGQSLRVRTESGRVVAGTLRDRTIEVRL